MKAIPVSAQAPRFDKRDCGEPSLPTRPFMALLVATLLARVSAQQRPLEFERTATHPIHDFQKSFSNFALRAFHVSEGLITSLNPTARQLRKNWLILGTRG